MITTGTPTTPTTTVECARTAAGLYDAECALHIAHQSHVDAWVIAANAKLHDAIAEHLAAVAAAASVGPANGRQA